LKNSDIYLESFSSENGFLLRSSINNFIKKESHSYIYLSPTVRLTNSDAAEIEGYSCQAYTERMSRITSWGGAIEIGTVAEIFSVVVCVYVPAAAAAATSQRKYKLMGVIRNSSPDT
jgi:hypothetical protein